MTVVPVTAVQGEERQLVKLRKEECEGNLVATCKLCEYSWICNHFTEYTFLILCETNL